jgi:hypothetical protein
MAAYLLDTEVQNAHTNQGQQALHPGWQALTVGRLIL